MFSVIFHSCSKNYIIHSSKKSFSKLLFSFFLSFVFISIYGFSQAFWLNLINLSTFFKTNSWFNACFKFLMWVTYLLLSFKLVTNFPTFSISFFLVKMPNHYEVIFHVFFSGFWISTSRIYPASLFINLH